MFYNILVTSFQAVSSFSILLSKYSSFITFIFLIETLQTSSGISPSLYSFSTIYFLELTSATTFINSMLIMKKHLLKFHVYSNLFMVCMYNCCNINIFHSNFTSCSFNHTIHFTTEISHKYHLMHCSQNLRQFHGILHYHRKNNQQQMEYMNFQTRNLHN